MEAPIVWLIGPVAIDMILQVEEYPRENGGCLCETVRVGIGWDAAIIAQSLNYKKKYLFGNHIGFSEDAKKARIKLTGLCEKFIEVGEIPDSPLLNVVISSKNGTRTWVSNVSPPNSVDLISAMKMLLVEAHPSIIYSDHWKASEKAKDFWLFLKSLKPLCLFYNWGDYGNLHEIQELLSVFPNAIVQVSLKNKDDLSTLNKIKLEASQFLVVTRDQNSVLLLGKSLSKEFPVTPLYDIDTTGAGGIFSATILNYLVPIIKVWVIQLPEIIQSAISDTYQTLKSGHSQLYPLYKI